MAAEPCTDMRGEWSLAKRMQNLLDSGDGSDVTFIVGEIPNVMSVPAHRAILSASSGVFNSMFFGPLKMEESVIELPDIDPKAYKIMLRYIYTDVINFESINEARLVLYAAKKYLLTPLSTKCREYLMENLGASNVFSVYKFAESIQGEEDLSKRCIQVISHQTNDLLKDTSFLNITPSMLDVILDQDNLSVISEADILKAVLAWSEAECKRREMVVTAMNKRKIIDFALCKIRLLSLSPSEFVKNTDLYDILTPEESYVILTNLVHPNIRPIPPAFCTNYMKRAASIRKCPNCGAVPKSVNLNFPESQHSLNLAHSGSQLSLSISDMSQLSMSSSAFGSNSQRVSMPVFPNPPAKTGTKLHCPYCGYHSL